jgi:hypothetical protein
MAVRTAKQKAALRKAQLASARKRRGKGKGRKGLKYAAGAAVIAGAGFAAYRASKRRKSSSSKQTDYGSIRYALDHPTIVNSSSPELNRAMRKAGRTGAPSSRSLKAVGYAFGHQANYAASKAKRIDSATRARHKREDAMWKAMKKRGMTQTGHSKAKYRRKNEARAKKKK